LLWPTLLRTQIKYRTNSKQQNGGEDAQIGKIGAERVSAERSIEAKGCEGKDRDYQKELPSPGQDFAQKAEE